MEKMTAILAGAILLGCGEGGDLGEGPVTNDAILTSDFTPPAGAATGPSEKGPWANRLLVAASADGLTWTRKNQLISDQADVPDLVMAENGWIYLYYLGWTVGTDINKVVVAISVDGGKAWAYKRVTLSGFTGMSEPVDPDVRILADGTFRMYVTCDPNDGKGPRTYRAEGADGTHFTNLGVAFAQSGKQVLDPTVSVVGETWHLFAGGTTTTPGANWHGTSKDGTSYASAGETLFSHQGIPCAVSNALSVSGGHRFYGFTHGTSASIVSFFSADGWNWKEESGYRLQVDASTGMEKGDVKDAAVLRLEDGSYLMVYVTAIP